MKITSLNRLRARLVQCAHASRRRSMFPISSINLRFNVVRNMRIYVFVFFIEMPTPSTARAPVRSAPVQMHGMPLSGAAYSPHGRVGDLRPTGRSGSPPMSVGWAGQFMLGDPPGPLTSPPNTTCGMRKRPGRNYVAITWQLRQLRGNCGRNWGYCPHERALFSVTSLLTRHGRMLQVQGN